MVKKSLVILQGMTVILLGALLFNQTTMTPEAARDIDRSRPLWFMHPWRPSPPAAPRDDGGQGPLTAPAGTESRLTEANRRYILAPIPALNAVITDLEGKDLEPTGPMLIPGQQVRSPVQSPAAARKKPPHQAPAKEAAPAGPIRITGLTVSPAADGVRLTVSTSSPPERLDLLNFASPPRMVLELYGQFADYDQPIIVPKNPIFASLTTELSPGKMRISGVLLTEKAYVTPVTSSGRHSITIGLTLNPGGQPDFETGR